MQKCWLEDPHERPTFSQLKESFDEKINIKYNNNPTIKKKGSAIFLHLTNNKYKPTKGCIAVLKKDFLEILSQINKKTKILIN